MCACQSHEDFQIALESRSCIGTAVGVTMVQQNLDETQALAFLVSEATTANVELRTFAEDVVRHARPRVLA